MGAEAGRRFRTLGSTVLPAGAVRGLAGVLLAGAVAMPWLAQWQGVLVVEPGEVVVEEAGAVVELRPELVRLPGGRFRMGSAAEEEGHRADEEPVHEAEVAAFEICRTEVTQGQWKAVMGTEPFDCAYGCGDDYPAQKVSWNDAVAFMNALTERENALRGEEPQMTACYEKDGESWAWTNKDCTGYRLPTETEWEYAARAGTTTAYSFGDDAKELCKHGNLADASGKVAHPDWTVADCDDGEANLAKVGRYTANPWGLYDMHGNVWEWVGDWYADKYPSEATPAAYAGPDSGAYRVLRGGSFWFYPRDLRSANRIGDLPTLSSEILGFRCVRVL